MAKGKLCKQFLSGPQEVPRRKQLSSSVFFVGCGWLRLQCVVVEGSFRDVFVV